MNPVAWKTCPDFKQFECKFTGDLRRKDGKPVILHVLDSGNKGKRSYLSLTDHWFGHVHRQVFKAFGPPNPDPERYTLIDHTDNNSFNNHINNLRWSNTPLNALNTNCHKGWTLDNSCNRQFKYKGQVKWLGKNHTIGRFKTAKEAEAAYYDCKDWIQLAYREHKYRDTELVRVWRTNHFLKDCQIDADPERHAIAIKNFNRVLTNLRNHFESEGRLFHDL